MQQISLIIWRLHGFYWLQHPFLLPTAAFSLKGKIYAAAQHMQPVT
jgi:hypothetical protein